MKELTKIRLINWHIFWNETIPVRGNILVTGENATGKSTLIDSIFFVLTGGNEKAFNSAANSNATRTLETYMRCKTGVDGREFLRPGPNLISHIALEFFDTDDNKPFVLGVSLEIRDNSAKPDQKFYHVIDGKVDDICFFDGDNIANFKALSEMSRRNNHSDIQLLDGSKADVRYAISLILGINNRKFNELLPKALAFRPITEVSQFVYSFLLPEKNVNLERIREDIRELRDIRNLIERDQSKHEDLSVICQNGTELKKQISEKNILNAFIKKQELDQLNREIIDTKGKLALAENKERELGRQISENEDALEAINRKKYEIQNSDSYRIISDNETQLAFERKEEKDLLERKSKFNKSIVKLSLSMKELGFKNSLPECISKADYQSLIEQIHKFTGYVSNLKNAVQSELNGLYAQTEGLKERRVELELERDDLKKGIHPYPAKVRNLIEYIKTGLSKITGKSEDVRPLCEFLEIPSKYDNWRNVIEGVLDTKRFDLVVSNRLFEKAVELYSEFNNEGKNADIGIVNGNLVFSAEEGSLAKMIYTEDTRARNYVNRILGNVCVVDSGVKRLLSRDGSANLDSMFYTFGAVRQGSLEIYGTPFIGAKSIQIRLDKTEKALEQCIEKLEELLLSIEKLEKKQKTINETSFFEIFDESNLWQLHADCLERISLLEEENKKLRDNSMDLFSRLDSYDEKIKCVKEKKLLLDTKRRELTKQLGSLGEKLKSVSVKYDELYKLFEVISKNSELMSALENFEKNGKLSRKECDERIRLLDISIKKLDVNVCNMMSKYIATYTFDSRPEIDCLDDFYTELNQVIDRHLVQYREKAVEAELNCRKGFQDSYIAEIRKHILDEKENINRLNRILSTRPFGNDAEVYKFEISKNKNPQFGVYYDVFVSNQDFNVNELFTDALSAENSSLLNELFERITRNPANEKEEKLLKEYTDYRMFMNYDIKITNKNGEVSYFSKINREKSGGETQTPFYVIIAASFDQLSQSSSRNSCGCVVILDEAFNNMDESRISAMMDYFTQLKIQLIIVVPPQRFHTIFKHVDTTVALSKSNNRAIPLTLFRNYES